MATSGGQSPTGQQQHWTNQPLPGPERGSPPGFGRQQDNAPPRLTPEEVRVMNQCRSESFWYRCIPFGALFVGTTHILVNKGFLKTGRYGSVGKSMAAALAGFVVGKISYQSKCREKLLRLENSPLADALRKGLSGPQAMKEIIGPVQPTNTIPESSLGESKHASMKTHLDMDMSQKENKGLDDGMRPTLDNEGYLRRDNNKTTPQAQYKTYDEIRRANREDYDRRLTSVQSPPPSPSPSYQQPSPGYSSAAPPPPKRQRTNQYGDVIED